MDFERHALILEAIRKLKIHGSWTGKTHVQKALFMLSVIDPDSVPFEFVLYKHGPYSFEVDAELDQMKSYAAILSSPIGDYGPMLSVGAGAEFIDRSAPIKYEVGEELDKISTLLGKKGVAQLEAIATAAWVIKRERLSVESRILQRIEELKPHIPDSVIKDAVKEVTPVLA